MHCSPNPNRNLNPNRRFQNPMSSSVQYSAFTRLLTHNTRVHDMEEMLKRMWGPVAVGHLRRGHWRPLAPQPLCRTPERPGPGIPGLPGQLLGRPAGGAGGRRPVRGLTRRAPHSSNPVPPAPRCGAPVPFPSHPGRGRRRRRAPADARALWSLTKYAPTRNRPLPRCHRLRTGPGGVRIPADPAVADRLSGYRLPPHRRRAW